MAKRINLNPKYLEKKKSKNYENKILAGIFIVFVLGLITYIGVGYFNINTLVDTRNNLKTETIGMDFNQSNKKLSQEIKAKSEEVNFINKLKGDTNYYTEIHEINKYIPKGVNISTVNVTGANIKLTGWTQTPGLVPLFLKNLKSNKIYSSAFLEGMENIKVKKNVVPKVVNDNQNTEEKTSNKVKQQIKEPVKEQEQSVKKTIFSIVIGGNTNETQTTN